MTTTNPPSGGQQDDALSQLEALLQKTKANKGQGGQAVGAPPDPGMSEAAAYAEAEKLAIEQAAQEEQFKAEQAQAEAARLQALEAQKAQMKNLEETPQYQARVHQDEEASKKAAENKAANEGLEILQVTTTKI